MLNLPESARKNEKIISMEDEIMIREEKNIRALRDEELDTVIGGALNQNIIAQYDLKSKDKKGLKVLYAKVEWAKGGSAVSSAGMQIESSLKELYNDPGLKSISFETNQGSWVSFSREQLGTLLKG